MGLGSINGTSGYNRYYKDGKWYPVRFKYRLVDKIRMNLVGRGLIKKFFIGTGLISLLALEVVGLAYAFSNVDRQNEIENRTKYSYSLELGQLLDKIEITGTLDVDEDGILDLIGRTKDGSQYTILSSSNYSRLTKKD